MFFPLKDENPTKTFPYMTILIIACSTFVFFIELAMGQYRGYFVAKFGMIPFEISHGVDINPEVALGPYITLLTSLFLHGSFFHLIGNMWFLWIFGNNIEDVVGHGFGKRFLPFIGGLAVFIFTANIFGLFYFVQPPTANPNTTFALSITAFLFYNIVGIKDNGLFKYLKHFAGPLPLLAPLMVPIEIISHLARILSLALRLFGNIFGEHTATGIFFVMFPFVVPWPMMGLGIFGALLQAFIFIMLTMAYLQGAVGAEEH